MSEIKISRVAAQNPTGLTPAAGYNKPATNTIGDFAQKQGITFKGQNDALSALEQSLAKNRELAQRFKGTRYEKVYQAQVEKLEKQLAQQKGTTAAATEAQALRDETAALQKEYEAAQAAKKAKETEQAWAQFENAPKGEKTYNEVFKFREAEKAAQESAARAAGLEKAAAEAGNLTTECHFPQGGAITSGGAEAATNESKGLVQKIKDIFNKKPATSAEAIDAGLGIGSAPKSAQESAGVFIKHDIEKALSKPATTSAESIDAALGIGAAGKSAQESYKVFEEAGKLGGKDVGKQKGLFGKIGS